MNPKLWWKGKLLPYEEWEKKMGEATKEDLLVCHMCLKPYNQVSKHMWKGDCNCVPKNMRISVG